MTRSASQSGAFCVGSLSSRGHRVFPEPTQRLSIWVQGLQMGGRKNDYSSVRSSSLLLPLALTTGRVNKTRYVTVVPRRRVTFIRGNRGTAVKARGC